MHVMAERGMNTADKRLVKTVSKRVGAALRHHRNKGLVKSVKRSAGVGGRLSRGLQFGAAELPLEAPP